MPSGLFNLCYYWIWSSITRLFNSGAIKSVGNLVEYRYLN